MAILSSCRVLVCSACATRIAAPVVIQNGGNDPCVRKACGHVPPVAYPKDARPSSTAGWQAEPEIPSVRMFKKNAIPKS